MGEDDKYFDNDDLVDDPDYDDEEDIEDDNEEEAEDEEVGRRPDITSYRTTREIFESGLFTAEERRREYRRRGKSPSGVIDGEYNDFYLDEGEIYNDFRRDWDAGA
jgi:hypothetical protein